MIDLDEAPLTVVVDEAPGAGSEQLPAGVELREPDSSQAGRVNLRVQFPYGAFDPGSDLPTVTREGVSVTRAIADEILAKATEVGAPVEQVK